VRWCGPDSKLGQDPGGLVDQLRWGSGEYGGTGLDKQQGRPVDRQAADAGQLGQHLGQLAGELDPGGPAATDHHGRQAARHGAVQATGGSVDEEQAERMIKRFPLDLLPRGWEVITRDDVNVGAFLSRLGCPLLATEDAPRRADTTNVTTLLKDRGE
jgi:hypothetical protein